MARPRLDRPLTNGYLQRVEPTTQNPALAWLALCAVVLSLSAGCGRGRGTLDEGQLVHHDKGFAMVVPPGWSMDHHADGISLASEEIVGEGYPTLRIDVVQASELPEDFLSGNSFRWASGKGSYENRRWANSLGNGYGVDVHLQGERIYLVISAEVWDARLTRDGRYFRKVIWPIVNSIVEEI